MPGKIPNFRSTLFVFLTMVVICVDYGRANPAKEQIQEFADKFTNQSIDDLECIDGSADCRIFPAQKFEGFSYAAIQALFEDNSQNTDYVLIIFAIKNGLIIGNEVHIHYGGNNFKARGVPFHWQNTPDRLSAKLALDSLLENGETTKADVLGVIRVGGLFFHQEFMQGPRLVQQYARPMYHPESYSALAGSNHSPDVIWILELTFNDEILASYSITATGFADEALLRKQIVDYWDTKEGN